MLSMDGHDNNSVSEPAHISIATSNASWLTNSVVILFPDNTGLEPKSDDERLKSMKAEAGQDLKSE